MEPVTPMRNIFHESKSVRKFDKQRGWNSGVSTPSLVSSSKYDRTPLVKPSTHASRDHIASDDDSEALEAAFKRLDSEGTGHITRQAILEYLDDSIRDSLELQWEDASFRAFAELHCAASCLQSHVECDQYTFGDFVEIVTSLRVCDNVDFISTRLFHRAPDADDVANDRSKATEALRSGLRLVWAKAGEIVCSQGQHMDNLVVVYHGSATGVRLTSAGHQQRLVSLAPGQVFGFFEMIVDQPALLTLTMDHDGTVMMLPQDQFKQLLRADTDMLWNTCYEVLTEVQRIFQFVHAAQFPRVIASTPSTANLEALEPSPDLSGVPLADIIERVFHVSHLTADELKEFRLVLLGAGAPLYEKGTKAAAFWLLINGQLDLPESMFCTIDGVRVVGEMGLLTGQDRLRDVTCVTKCTMLRISLQGLHGLVAKNMEVMWMLARPALQRVLGHLASVNVGFEHRILRSGKDLYRAGEVSDSLYILINGRLRIIDPLNEASVVDVSKPGESIGEVSLLLDSPHNHSVFAVRDTELLVLNREAFEAVIQQNPHKHIKTLFRTVRERSVHFGSSKFGHKPSRVRTVAVLSTSPAIHVDHFTELLCTAVEGCGHSVRLITGEMIRSRFPAITKPEDMRFSRGIAYYMSNQEDSYDTIICLADNSSKSAWTRWLLRQVDMIMLVGYSDESPVPTLERELNLFHGSKEKSPLAEMHLVLVHAPEQERPVGTAEWLKHRPKIKQHHHIKVDREADFQRLARVITGQTVGVVLSGGGARGIAHLGVLRGLMEMGVPIDAVGGASMGSQIAGLIAQELDISEMMRRLEDFYVRGYYRALLWDISIFPYIALLTGEAFVNRLRRLLGPRIEIEDLWIPYFCVSANLTKRKAHIHDSGPLWQACRASASLPLLIPPTVLAGPDGGILMDGGLMNNLPVDVARVKMGCDIVIAVDVSTPGSLPLMPYTTHVSGWSVLLDVLSRGNSAVEMLLYLSQIVDEGTRDTREQEADVYIRPNVSGTGLLDWDPDTQMQLIQEGHSAALASLSKLKVDQTATWQKCTGIVSYAPRLMQEYSLRHRNHWKRIAAFLGFVLSILALHRYSALLARLRDTTLNWAKEWFWAILNDFTK